MHCVFASGPELVTIAAPEGAARNRYRVNGVEVITGAAPGLPKPGWEMARVESPQLVAAEAPVLFRGLTGTAQYTDPKAHYAAANGLPAIGAGGGAVLAVLIPLRKTARWYGLSHEERKALLPAHVDAGIPYIPTIHRRLFHTREFTSEFDFLTYFEFRAADEGAFRSLCRALRDTRRNPEWGYIDRECEIWMTKLA